MPFDDQSPLGLHGFVPKRDSPTESSTQRRFSHLRPAPLLPQIREFPSIIRGNIPFWGRRIHRIFTALGMPTKIYYLQFYWLIDYTHSTLWMYLTSYNPSTSSLSSKYINGGGGGRSRWGLNMHQWMETYWRIISHQFCAHSSQSLVWQVVP